MNRKLTEKEQDFLLALRELMANHNVMLSATQDNAVCLDIDYTGDDDFEPVVLTKSVTSFYDLDIFIEQNS